MPSKPLKELFDAVSELYEEFGEDAKL